MMMFAAQNDYFPLFQENLSLRERNLILNLKVRKIKKQSSPKFCHSTLPKKVTYVVEQSAG